MSESSKSWPKVPFLTPRVRSENSLAESAERWKPESIVRDVLKYIRKGKVLDVGTGRGNNALFLAENGFQVTALDKEDSQLGALRQRARKSGLLFKIQAVVHDVEKKDLRGEYDVVISNRMLNFLPREQALRLIENMKAHTKEGGLNVISTATKNGDFYDAIKERERQYGEVSNDFYPDPEEIRSLYGDWEILTYEEAVRIYQAGIEAVPENETALLIARKPKKD